MMKVIAILWLIVAGAAMLIIVAGFAAWPHMYPLGQVALAAANDVILASPAIRYLLRRRRELE